MGKLTDDAFGIISPNLLVWAEILVQLIEDVSSLTHRHKRSKLACIIYVVFASQLYKGFDKLDALEYALAFAHKYCAKEYREENQKREEKYIETINNFSVVMEKVNENLINNNKRLEYIENKLDEVCTDNEK